MSTQIAEATPSSSSASAAKPLPTAREAGLTSIADALANATKTPVAEPKPVVAHEPPEAKEKPATVKPALLESLSEPEVKQPAVESKQPKEDQVKRAAEWKRITEENKAFEAETATLRKQVEEAKKWEKELADLRPKAEKADEYNKRLLETAFEKSDAFKAIVDDQQRILGTAKTLAKEFEVGEEVIDKALMLSGRKRLEFLKESFGDPTDAIKFDNILESYDSKESFKTAELKRSRERSESMTQAERDLALNEDARKKQEVISAYEAAIPKFEDKLPGYFKKKDGDAAQNAMVDEIIATGRQIVESGDAETQAEALGLAAVARALIRRLPAVEKENAQLKERLRQYTANEPRVPSGDNGSDSGSANERVGMMDHLRRGAR